MRETPKIVPIETLTHYLRVGYQTATKWLSQGKFDFEVIVELQSPLFLLPFDKTKSKSNNNLTGTNSSLKGDRNYTRIWYLMLQETYVLNICQNRLILTNIQIICSRRK